jgi:hypothetical protein
MEYDWIEKLKLEQNQRIIELAKNFHQISDAEFAVRSSSIRWHARYIRQQENKLKEIFLY